MDLEEVEEEAAVVEVEVLEEVADGGGSDFEARLALRRPVFAPIAEQLFLIDADYLVFKRDAQVVALL